MTRRMRHMLAIACKRELVVCAAKFSLVVGPILCLINHGDQIMYHTMTSTDWMKAAVTMLVPYMVSTISGVNAYLNCESQ
ncbi:MAG: nitrate/nitrite transporter NrtS [Mariprofundales bacterium]